MSVGKVVQAGFSPCDEFEFFWLFRSHPERAHWGLGPSSGTNRGRGRHAGTDGRSGAYPATPSPRRAVKGEAALLYEQSGPEPSAVSGGSGKGAGTLVTTYISVACGLKSRSHVHRRSCGSWQEPLRQTQSCDCPVVAFQLNVPRRSPRDSLRTSPLHRLPVPAQRWHYRSPQPRGTPETTFTTPFLSACFAPGSQ